MTKKMLVRVLAAASVVVTLPVGAQSLASRVAAVRDGRVQFTYAARPGVCGNGRTYIQTGPNSYDGEFWGSINEVTRLDPCIAGPVRVVLDRGAGAVVSIKTYVGPPTRDPGASDVGRVPAQQAADYLLELARTSEGRAGREAILPAMLADSANTSDPLLAIARDRDLPRETRSTAIAWTGRSVDGQTAIPASVIDALVKLARDEDDNVQIRQQALRSLGRLEHAAGVPALIDLTRTGDQQWMRREALSALARSGDPRARDVLRATIEKGDASDELLSTAIRSLGTQYATAKDAQFLRGVYPKLGGERAKDAVLTSLADMGGAENTKWLLGIASSADESSNIRRRALQAAVRAGVPTSELIKMYDNTTDPQMKEALLSQFGQNGDRAAVDKLIAIAKNDESMNVRRRAISQLSRSDDPRVRDLLRGIVER